jgi:hypothetical protein
MCAYVRAREGGIWEKGVSRDRMEEEGEEEPAQRVPTDPTRPQPS